MIINSHLYVKCIGCKHANANALRGYAYYINGQFNLLYTVLRVGRSHARQVVYASTFVRNKVDWCVLRAQKSSHKIIKAKTICHIILN